MKPRARVFATLRLLPAHLPTLLPTLGIALLSAGCDPTDGSPKGAPVARETTSAAPLAAGSAGASAAVSAPASAAASADPGRRADKKNQTPPSAKARSAFLKELTAGRKLAGAKDWAGAVKAFERALAASPDEPRALADLGWAAFQANDLDRAESANQRALAHAKEPKLRAPILYNMGRVAEARGNKEAAKKAYSESLALRDNAEVKKRLDALGGEAAANAAQPASGAQCAQPFANVEALCACLQKTDLMVPEGVKFVCAPASPSPALGDPRLGVLVYGADMMGERVHLLTVQEGGKIRGAVELGRDYEPGAFGVHNSAKVVSGEKRTIGGHTVIVVRSEQDNNDSNLAGLELCTYFAKLETVCALGGGKAATQCSPAIPVAVETGCGPGVEVPESELDDEMRKAVAEIKKNQTKSTVKSTWSLSDDGKLTVTVTSGSRDMIDAELFRPRSLW